MTRIYDIIYISDKFYVVDKEAKPEKDAYFYWYDSDGETKIIEKCIGVSKNHLREYWQAKSDNEYGYGDWSEDYGSKIIASNDPSLGLPLLPKDDIEIVGNCANCGVEYHIHTPKKWTDEDMWKATQFGYQESFYNESPNGNETYLKKADFDIWLQSLNPLPKKIWLEVENDIPLVENGYVKVNKWEY